MTTGDAGADAALSVLGLGKLGACLAALFAARGFRVIGADLDEGTVARINAGVPPVQEPGLAETLRAAEGRLAATTDVEAAVAGSDVTFVLVPTPSELDGRFSLRHVLPVCEQIGRSLRSKPSRHVVALSSTVMPGDTAGPIREQIEKASGRVAGEGFGLCYNPAFVALGSVLRDFLNPDFVLIGESDPEAGAALAAVYRRVCPGAPPVERVSLINAELIKLSLNAFVTTKISFANALASLCERLPGADVDVVTRALGRDRRIGERGLRGGMPYGGPCFPRDNRAFAAVAGAAGAPPLIAEATDRVNQARVAELAELVRRRLPPGGTAAVLGLAYKPGTGVVEGSPGVSIARELAAGGVRVVCHDPAALEAVRGLAAETAGRVTTCPDVGDCVRQADVVLVAMPWTAYTGLSPETLARPGRPRVVVDAWRALPGLAGVDGIDYVVGGRGPDGPAGSPADRAEP